MRDRLTRLLEALKQVRVPRWAWLALAFVLAAGMGVALGSWSNLCTDCPSIAQIYTYEPQQTSKIYARDQRLITEIGLERRTPVSMESLPPHVPQAFIAIEDRRFYSHRGLDWRGIARAVAGVVRNRSLSGGGGSTITQQLARNMWTERLGFEKRVTRKLKEWQVAMALERAYSKDQILEAYMNQIGYAHGWYGLQTASRNYFGKNASDMNPAEAALLAAIANLPERYTPLRYPEAAVRRRNLVLDQMAAQGYLTDDDAQQWKSEPVPLERATAFEEQAPYFTEWGPADPGRPVRKQTVHGGSQDLHDSGPGYPGVGREVDGERLEPHRSRAGIRAPHLPGGPRRRRRRARRRDALCPGHVHGRGPAFRPCPGHDRGPGLQSLQVQPRDPGPAPGGVGLQALRVLSSLGERGPPLVHPGGQRGGAGPARRHDVETQELRGRIPRAHHDPRRDPAVGEHDRHPTGAAGRPRVPWPRWRAV